MKEVSLESIIDVIKERILDNFDKREHEFGYDCKDMIICEIKKGF